MFPIILRLAFPYLQRYLTGKAAEYGAGYLNQRRERHLRPPEEVAAPEEEAELPVCPPAYSGGDMVWFTLSGVVLGSALGVMVSYLTKREL